ncbi:MAG TPA: RseA family anti-sigma factor, partial [Arenimonas sp.]|nr:RseA family anti-sigma factor [Arenimonas sp.]
MKPITETDLEQISAYIDGELSDSERRFLQKRLSNDPELRACCERIWIASSVLKSQPFQIMPKNNAELIGNQCVEKRSYFNSPIRLVASFGAMAIVVGLGFQLMKTADTSSTVAQTTVSATNSETVLAEQVPPEVSSNQTAAVVVAQDATSIGATTNPKPFASQNSNTGQNVAQTDPSQFELNENTRSKTWPRSTQGMDEYLVRHNQ